MFDSITSAISGAISKKNPRVEVSIGSQIISGFTEVTISAGIERIPRTFHLGVTGEIRAAIIKASKSDMGMPIRISIFPDGTTKNLVLSGYSVGFEDALSENDHQVQYVGSGVCVDLVECTAEFFDAPNLEMLRSGSIGDAITTIASVYDINTSIAVDAAKGPVDGILAINVGDTAFAAVDYLGKYVGCLVYEAGDGKLTLANVGAEPRSKTTIDHAHCVHSRIRGDMAGLSSDYSIYTQPQINDQGAYGTATPGLYHETFWDDRKTLNSGKQRRRPYRKIADMILNQNIYPQSGAAGPAQTTQQIYATWLGRRQMGRSAIISVTVVGWADDQGKLWTPNSLVSVSLPKQGITKPIDLLITECEYAYSLDEGTVTHMVLMAPSAFGVEPTGNNTNPIYSSQLTPSTPSTPTAAQPALNPPT